MERILYFLGFLSLGFAFDFEESLGHIKATASAGVQESAAENLINRIIPEDSYKFVVEINKEGSRDYFKLEKLSNGKIKITGTTGVAIASGFNHFLKYFCKCQISWETTQLNLPKILPDINVTITLNDKFRYYQNVCTPGYSFTWWNWKQWEKHIDWMALNSFNLVLAFNGQEAVWERVYQKLNLTGKEIREHFSGPAFLPWNRMGNIRGWAGPLSASWHSRSLFLQKQILRRMRELGIIPVLPAFAGQVPRAFKRIFPDAKLQPLQTWNRFNDTYCCPYLLEPNEPLFKTIGRMFMEELISEFGTDHIYSCDTFNEMIPSSNSEEYLRSIGQSVYNAMTEVDPKAIWLMQGWLFHHDSDFWTYQAAKSLLENVPLGKMILLDLQSEQFPQYERLDSYFGQPFIFCMLHNFGGTLGMYGSVDIINNRVFEARSMNGSTMIGTGLTPEGINQNYVIYDLMVEMAWRKTPVNLTNWFNSYAERRYGTNNANAQNAWEILKHTAYNFKGLEKIRGKFAYNKTPRTNIKTWTWYNHCELLDAWDCLMAASDELGNSTGYLHDLVDLTRQVLQNFGDEFYNEMIQGFKKKNIIQFEEAANVFAEIFVDVEKILASNKAFLLGNWLNDAKNCADKEEDRKLFEYNARNQITLWGPNGEIMDYANKQWSGMVSHFFEPRWSLFIRSMNDSLISQRPFKESQVTKNIFKTVEEPFTFDRTSFPDQSIGDSIEIANEIYRKWRNRGHCRVERSRKYESEVPNDQRPRVVLVD